MSTEKKLQAKKYLILYIKVSLCLIQKVSFCLIQKVSLCLIQKVSLCPKQNVSLCLIQKVSLCLKQKELVHYKKNGWKCSNESARKQKKIGMKNYYIYIIIPECPFLWDFVRSFSPKRLHQFWWNLEYIIYI